MNRRFLAVAGGAVAAGSVGLGGYAGFVEPRRARFTRHAVNPRASAAQRQITLVQISDVHLRSVGAMHRRIAARVNAIHPDLLLFTGDSVDRADGLPHLERLLALFDGRTPAYAILGNWEHWSGVDLGALADVYRRANCRLLVNESAVLDVGGRALRVTGLDDLVGGRPDPRRAFAGAEGADAHLLLAHCPEHRDRLAAAPDLFGRGAAPNVTMMLAGHTHGGQVSVLGWPPALPPGSGRYVRGWFREPGAVPLYVSRGIGTSVVPVRFGPRRKWRSSRCGSRKAAAVVEGQGTQNRSSRGLHVAIETTYGEARKNFARHCNAAAGGEVVIIRRHGAEDVALVAASELAGLMETLHLLRSPANAARLLRALERADRRR